MAGWKGKRVFIKTGEDKCFQGNVISETDNSITITDKFNCTVMLRMDEIKILKEESEW